MIGRMTRVGAGMLLLPVIAGAAALGGVAVGALGLYAAQRAKRERGDRDFGGGFSNGARQTDGEDASASFEAGIADENTVPGRDGMPIAPM